MDEALTCSALAWNPPSVDPLALLDETRHLPVIDVRSPGEFEKGHIPGALNVLIFDVCERAEIGTVYKRQGQAAAIALGLEFSQSKVDQYVNSVRRITNGSSVRVHCWRGGMRSRGFSWLLAEDGFHPEILQGGYKAYRRAVQASFGDPLPIVILSGLSGAGKSRMLELLRREGEQVIDLEGLAKHRGSAFGGLGQPFQPTVKQFENALFDRIRKLDSSRPVWLEDECQAIGKVRIPQSLWQQMRDAPAVFLDAPRPARVQLLIEEYGALSTADLASATDSILRRLGGARWKAAREALEADNRVACAGILLDYYDKSYLHAAQKRPRADVTKIFMPSPADKRTLPELKEISALLLKSQSKSARHATTLRVDR